MTQNEVKNNSDRVRYEDSQQHPEHRAHAAAFCVSGDIAKQQDVTGEYCTRQSSKNEWNYRMKSSVSPARDIDGIQNERDWNDSDDKCSDRPRYRTDYLHFVAKPAHRILLNSLFLPRMIAATPAVAHAASIVARNQGPA